MLQYQGNNLFNVYVGHQTITLSTDEIQEIINMAYESNKEAPSGDELFSFEEESYKRIEELQDNIWELEQLHEKMKELF